jgi:hypothetical protein
MQQKLLMGSISPVDFVKEVCPETKTFVAKVKKAVKKTTPAAAAKPAEKKKAAPVKAKAKTTLTNAKESAQAINSSYYHGRKVTPEDEFNQKYAPKKIDPAAVAAEKAAHVAQGHSSWNKSGSWEETDLEAWALADLKTKLTAVTGTDYKVGELTVSFEDWKITGDACMSVGKGKKRINFELIAKVEFKGTLGDAEVKGKITSPNVDDVDGIDGDFDVNLAVDSPRKGPGFTAVKTSMKPLVKDLRKAINAFIKELMSKKD